MDWEDQIVNKIDKLTMNMCQVMYGTKPTALLTWTTTTCQQPVQHSYIPKENIAEEQEDQAENLNQKAIFTASKVQSLPQGTTGYW